MGSGIYVCQCCGAATVSAEDLNRVFCVRCPRGVMGEAPEWTKVPPVPEVTFSMPKPGVLIIHLPAMNRKVSKMSDFHNDQD